MAPRFAFAPVHRPEQRQALAAFRADDGRSARPGRSHPGQHPLLHETQFKAVRLLLRECMQRIEAALASRSAWNGSVASLFLAAPVAGLAGIGLVPLRTVLMLVVRIFAVVPLQHPVQRHFETSADPQQRHAQ